MNEWRVVVRPEAGDDIERAAAWYFRNSILISDDGGTSLLHKR